MKAKMIWGNVSVKDVKRTREFYNQLGCKPNGPNTSETLASFLFGDGGFVIHFFAQDSSIADFLPADAEKGNDIIFTLSAETEEEVNELADKVTAAGGNIFREVRRDEAGYYGFAFTDPDGLKFNVLLMDNM
jgi:predicted lactoylglutathione lyase